MGGFLFVVVLIMSILIIVTGLVSYIINVNKRQNDNIEIKIFGLKASTFYIISIASLVILCCLYENPVSATWRTQHRLDSIQSKRIDSIERSNAILNANIDDLKGLLELHHKLYEELISSMNKRNVIVINNYHKRFRRWCDKDSLPCNKRKDCGK